MNKLCRNYIRKIKTLFPIMGKSERHYIKTIQFNVDDFLADKADSNLDDLYKEFGTPEDVINNYYLSVDTDNIIKRIRISKYFKIFLIVLILCLLSLTTYRLVILYEGHQVFMEEQIQSEETIIE